MTEEDATNEDATNEDAVDEALEEGVAADAVVEDATDEDAVAAVLGGGAIAGSELADSELADDLVAADAVASGDAIAASAAASLLEDDDDDDDRNGVIAGWSFLAVLFAIFLALVLWAVSRDDDGGSNSTVDAGTGSTTTVASGVELTPTDILLTVSEDGKVVISGSVPDEGARRQLIDAATELYGSGNVTDSLTVDDSTTLTGGSISTTGTAANGDQNISLLVGEAKQLGLTEGELGVVFGDKALVPATATAVLATDTVTLAGGLPSQAEIDQLIATSAEKFGADNVDSTGLFIDAGTTMDAGQVLVSGQLDAGDTRGAELVSGITGALSGVTVDGSEVTVDDSAEALGRLEARLKAAVEASPILFATGSFEIDAESDAIVEQLAAAIKAAPGVPVEVVGHTDNQGGDSLNQQLSEGRANAVMERLVELGVDAARLSATGAGESDPVADNGTDEGRAANRRIAFEFEGAAG